MFITSPTIKNNLNPHIEPNKTNNQLSSTCLHEINKSISPLSPICSSKKRHITVEPSSRKKRQLTFGDSGSIIVSITSSQKFCEHAQNVSHPTQPDSSSSSASSSSSSDPIQNTSSIISDDISPASSPLPNLILLGQKILYLKSKNQLYFNEFLKHFNTTSQSPLNPLNIEQIEKAEKGQVLLDNRFLEFIADVWNVPFNNYLVNNSVPASFNPPLSFQIKLTPLNLQNRINIDFTSVWTWTKIRDRHRISLGKKIRWIRQHTPGHNSRILFIKLIEFHSKKSFIGEYNLGKIEKRDACY